MLHDARAVEAIDIRQRDGARVFLDAEMDEADVAVEIVALEGELREGDDAVQLGDVGVAALFVEGVVLDEIDGDVVGKGPRHVLVRVELRHEGAEDGFLLRWRGGSGRAVGRVGHVDGPVRIAVWRRRCQEGGQGGENSEDGGE